MLHVNVDLYHTTNRTATTNGPISLAGAAGLGKYGYGNGIAVMERISGTVLLTSDAELTTTALFRHKNRTFAPPSTLLDLEDAASI